MNARRSHWVYALVTPFLFMVGCSGGNQTPDDAGRASLPHQLPDPETISRAESLADSGYALLELGRFDEAIALMKESRSIFPASCWAHYNLACAYSRSGDRSAALAELRRSVDAGWDNYGHMEGDPDLAPLREDPAFTDLLTRAKENAIERLQPLAQGLPEVEFEMTFPSPESLNAYFRNEGRPLQQHGRHLFEWQRTLAEIELQAKRNLAVVIPPDSTHDKELGRVRILGLALGPWQAWGPVADGTIHEARNYLAANPASEKRGEAIYWAGVAAYCRTHPEPAAPGWAEAVRDARGWFAQIPSGSEYEGGAAAWSLMFDLEEVGENKHSLASRLREFATQYRDDQHAMEIASYFFMDDVVQAEWPIPFAATDMDGKEVTLDQYRGKVVLLCYWAAW